MRKYRDGDSWGSLTIAQAFFYNAVLFTYRLILGPLLVGKVFDSIGRRTLITLTLVHASLAASSAYLTVSEIFPLEIRALAIAVFYASKTLVGRSGRPGVVRVPDSNRFRD